MTRQTKLDNILPTAAGWFLTFELIDGDQSELRHHTFHADADLAQTRQLINMGLAGLPDVEGYPPVSDADWALVEAAIGAGL